MNWIKLVVNIFALVMFYGGMKIFIKCDRSAYAFVGMVASSIGLTLLLSQVTQ